MLHGALDPITLTIATAFLLAAAVPCPAGQASGSPESRVLQRALRLLPARPDVPVRLIDPDLAGDPEAIRRVDAFLVRERDGQLRRVIYVNSRSPMFDKAIAGDDLDIGILAAVIQHELAHLRGGSEADARRAERSFFQGLVSTGHVPTAQGLRYLAILEQARQLRERM